MSYTKILNKLPQKNGDMPCVISAKDFKRLKMEFTVQGDVLMTPIGRFVYQGWHSSPVPACPQGWQNYTITNVTPVEAITSDGVPITLSHRAGPDGDWWLKNEPLEASEYVEEYHGVSRDGQISYRVHESNITLTAN